MMIFGKYAKMYGLYITSWYRLNHLELAWNFYSIYFIMCRYKSKKFEMADDQNKFIASNEKSSSIITKEMVLEVLRKDKGSDAILKSFKVIDFAAKGDNYSSFVTSIDAEYTIEVKISSAKYIAKMNPKRGFSAGEAFTASQFKHENKFYAVLLPELNEILQANHQEAMRVPKFYHYSDEAGSQIMIFEDMRERGFKLFDRLKGVKLVSMF